MDTSVPPIEAVLAENDSLKQEVAQLRAQIAWLKQRLFGGGRSERLDRSQLLLELDELQKRAAGQSERIQRISYERRAGQPAEVDPLVWTGGGGTADGTLIKHQYGHV
jgi:hypothetical protein